MNDFGDREEFISALYEMLVPGGYQIKIAKLIAITCRGKEIPTEEFVNAALDQLVDRKDVTVFGNYYSWRHSEIKRLSVDER